MKRSRSQLVFRNLKDYWTLQQALLHFPEVKRYLALVQQDQLADSFSANIRLLTSIVRVNHLDALLEENDSNSIQLRGVVLDPLTALLINKACTNSTCQSLRLNHNDLRKDFVKQLASIRCKLLSVQYNAFDEQIVTTLFNGANKISQSLLIRSCALTFPLFALIPTSYFQTLKVLELYDNLLGDCAHLIFERIGKSVRLQSLGLGKNKIRSVNTIQQILKSLDLQQIKEEDFQRIKNNIKQNQENEAQRKKRPLLDVPPFLQINGVAYLQNYRNLQEVNLMSNQIDSRSMPLIQQVLSRNSCLRIYLQGNPISSQQLKKIKQLQKGRRSRD